MDAVGAQILQGLKIGKKTHGFDANHDDNVPAQMWFQNSIEGLVLFIVFYTQACRWSRCIGCNLTSLCSPHHISYKALGNQMDWVFSHTNVEPKSADIKKVIVSNNGSVLDHETFSSTALMYLMYKLNRHFPNLAVLSVETRIEYVEVNVMEFLSRSLAEGDTHTDLELAIGFEIFDDHLRNDVFQKGLTIDKFEHFVEKISPFNFRLKCYFMQKPVPDMTDEAAIHDVVNAIQYLGRISKSSGVMINMHLNPTYVARGTLIEKSFKDGNYIPPKLNDVARAVLHAENSGITVFVGLSDEGLAAEGGSFIRQGDEEIVAALDAFNRTQDYNDLRKTLGL